MSRKVLFFLGIDLFLILFLGHVFTAQIAKATVYKRPLFDTSMQLGEDQPIDLLFSNMERNDVTNILGFFYVDPEEPDYDINQVKKVLKKYPGQVVPFFQSDWNKAEDLKPEAVKRVFEKAKLFRGLGEIQTFDEEVFEGVNADSKVLTNIYALLEKSNLMIMTHPPSDQEEFIASAFERFPKLIFIQHGLDIKPASWTKLMEKYPNFYFSLDAGHFMYWEPEENDLLWVQNMTKDQFVRTFDKNYDSILRSAVEKWKPYVERNPDRFMWGSEIGLKWHFEPEVYDRVIKFSRAFIGELSPDVQERFAYKNAEKVFGLKVDTSKGKELKAEKATKTKKKKEPAPKKTFFKGIIFWLLGSFMALVMFASVVYVILRRRLNKWPL